MKRDSRLAAYRVLALQRFQCIKVYMGENGNRHYSQSFGIFAVQMTYLDAMLPFLLSSRFSARSEAFQPSYGLLVFHS